MTVIDARVSVGSRDRSIDIAKGIAIIAIVLGHVLRGAAGADIVDGQSALFDELDTALYAVHLPVFAFLSGIFVSRGVERSGRADYLSNRLALFAYLYVVWTVLQGAVKVATGTLANSPVTPRGVIESLWLPDTQMWFLPFLAMVTIAAALVTPWRGRQRAALSTAAAVLLSLATWGLAGAAVGTQGLGLVAFFWAGVVLGPRGLDTLRPRAGWLLVATSTIFATVLALSDPVAPTSSHQARVVDTVALGVIASTAGTVAILCLSQVLAAGRGVGWLSLLGQRSLEIFLAHIIFTAATRIALVQAGVSSVAAHLVIGTVVGIIGPLVVWWAGGRLGVPWLFTMPEALSPARRRP